MFTLDTARIGIIGLGYVGLPLAVEFSKKRPTIGFDLKARRIDELRRHVDVTREVSTEELQQAGTLEFSCDINELAQCNVFIVATL